MPVTVRWGTDRFEFELPPPNTKLAAIRHSIAAYTQLPYDAFQIVHDGAVMVDDNANISAYYLRANSTIAIVSNEDVPPPFKNSEQAQIASIRAEVDAARTNLAPLQRQFISDLHDTLSKKRLTKEHNRLGEMLLQALLRLDAIVPEQDWGTARAERKGAVKELQSLLDELDKEWADAI